MFVLNNLLFYTIQDSLPHFPKSKPTPVSNDQLPMTPQLTSIPLGISTTAEGRTIEPPDHTLPTQADTSQEGELSDTLSSEIISGLQQSETGVPTGTPQLPKPRADTESCPTTNLQVQTTAEEQTTEAKRYDAALLPEDKPARQLASQEGKTDPDKVGGKEYPYQTRLFSLTLL